MEHILESGQHSVSTVIERKAMMVSSGSSTWLYVAKDKSGSLYEAFAELSKFFTGSVDQGVCNFLHDLYITQVMMWFALAFTPKPLSTPSPANPRPLPLPFPSLYSTCETDHSMAKSWGRLCWLLCLAMACLSKHMHVDGAVCLSSTRGLHCICQQQTVTQQSM